MYKIESNLRAVQQRIADAAARAGRDPKDITLIAVSKTFPAEAIIAAYERGLRNFGENRVEEASEKIPAVQEQLANHRFTEAPNLIWHLVGHLQSRKVKNAVALFDCIHSVDSVELAESISERAAQSNKTIAVLLEVNTSGEASKFGFPIEAREDFFNATEKIMALPSLNVDGLMTIAPIVAQPDDARPHFAALRVLRDELRARHPEHSLPHLSMGMSHDFPAAISEGATMVRIGRAIFGERK